MCKTNKTILIVEDQMLIAMSEKIALEKYGYNVITANTGETAVEMVKDGSAIDLILMDIDLGNGIDGTETAGMILRNHDIPIVFLSSHTETAVVEKTEKISSYGYVVKNSGIAILDASIKMAFKLFEAYERTKTINNKLEAILDGSYYDYHSPREEMRDDPASELPGEKIPDITEKRRMEESLIASERRYRRLFETAKDGILILDAETGKILDVNPFLIEMLGFTKEQFLEKNIWEIGTFQNIIANQDNFLELQNKGYIRYENLPLEAANGDTVDVEFVSNVYVVDNHKVIQCNIRNITDRKIAEELIATLFAEKELILKEGHHRIKNNMATISSLLALQAETLTNPEAIAALKDAGSRIESMMMLYKTLYQSVNFNSVSVLSYFPSLTKEILANFPNAESVNVENKIEDFNLSADILQPLGILLNELLTNIMKYAFAGRESGSIRICASRRGENVLISVEDDGNGIPESVDFANSPGFGLALVNMLARQLKGHIRIERGKGTKIVLEFVS